MDLLIKRQLHFVIILLCLSEICAEGISCFKCFVTPSTYDENDRLCLNFDGSAKYQAFCPSSTFCMKKVIHYYNKTSVITTVQRDCARQKSTLQVYDAKTDKWYYTEEVVKNAYEEGCFPGIDKGTPGGPSEYCFCSFHLCNAAPLIKLINVHTFMLLCSVLLTTKLIQNHLLDALHSL